MEMITLLGGNDLPMTRPLPRLLIMGCDEATPRFWEHIKAQTDLDFKPACQGFDAQPETCEQIVKLLLSMGRAKIRYYDNWKWRNTLILKNDHHNGFNVESICYDCVKYNNIHLGDLKPGDRLAC